MKRPNNRRFLAGIGHTMWVDDMCGGICWVCRSLRHGRRVDLYVRDLWIDDPDDAGYAPAGVCFDCCEDAANAGADIRYPSRNRFDRATSDA